MSRTGRQPRNLSILNAIYVERRCPRRVGETTDRPSDGCRNEGRSSSHHSTIHDSSIDPARAKQSFHRLPPARLFIVFETMKYTESSPLSPRARARKNTHTTGQDSPPSPLGGASTARARMEGSTVRDDARASVPGARRGARGEASARFFFARSPFGRRSVADRTGTAAREDARNRGHGDCRWSAPSVEVRRDAVGDSRASALVT